MSVGKEQNQGKWEWSFWVAIVLEGMGKQAWVRETRHLCKWVRRGTSWIIGCLVWHGFEHCARNMWLMYVIYSCERCLFTLVGLVQWQIVQRICATEVVLGPKYVMRCRRRGKSDQFSRKMSGISNPFNIWYCNALFQMVGIVECEILQRICACCTGATCGGPCTAYNKRQLPSFMSYSLCHITRYFHTFFLMTWNIWTHYYIFEVKVEFMVLIMYANNMFFKVIYSSVSLTTL